MLTAEAVARHESVALGPRQLRQLAMLLGDELRRQHERRQIGLGEVPVVVALFLRALRANGVLLGVIQQRLLRHGTTRFDERDLAVALHGQRLLDERERVDVLHLGAGAERGFPRAPHRDVGVDPQTALLHVAIGNADVLEQLLQGLEVRARFRRRTQIGATDDLDERHARTIEIDRGRFGEPIVNGLAGVFLDVQPDDRGVDDAALGREEREGAVGGERLIELRDLVALGEIGIEIILARKDALRMHRAAECERAADGETDGGAVGGGQCARQAETDGADLRVGRRTERRGAAAEHLGLRAELHVRLEPDDRFPTHQASSVAGTTRSSAYAASIISSSRNACPISWPPSGSPFARPIGREIAGRPARFAVTVKMSDMYIAIGSASFSPALKAGLGTGGVNRRSTPRSNTFRKSWAISARICWARP